MIVKNSLLNSKYIIYQNDEWFKFSIDSVLLANFVTVNLKCKKVMDFACGNGAVAMLLSFRTKAIIDGIELQKCVYDLGVLSVKENMMDKQINLINGDICNIGHFYSPDSFDTVVCNPPYFNTKFDGYYNSNDIKKIARHEVCLNLDDLLSSAFYILKNGGNLAMVHRSERFIDIIAKLREYHFEPKKIQFIYPKDGKDSDLFLIEATKNGKVGLKILPGLVLHNADGSYCDNIRKLYDL